METEGKRTGVFKVTGELLHLLLKLPADAVVTGFSPQVFFDQDAYAIRVESKVFPVVPEGHAATHCNPQYRKVDGRPEFVGWGMSNGAKLRDIDPAPKDMDFLPADPPAAGDFPAVARPLPADHPARSAGRVGDAPPPARPHFTPPTPRE